MARPQTAGPVCYASPKKRYSHDVLRQVSRGTGWLFQVGGALHPNRAACFYGVTTDTLDLLRAAGRTGADWFYVDNAYFRRGEYFRVTRNAVQHNGLGVSDGQRWRTLGLDLKPWRSGGRHVLICPQSRAWHAWFMDGDTPEAWATRIAAELRQHTDRPIVVRYKPQIARPTIREAIAEAARQLAAALDDCHAVVVHQSGVGIQAAMAGVPVFALGAGAVGPMACADLSCIEAPVHPERLPWAQVLADNQWTLRELANGTFRRSLGLG